MPILNIYRICMPLTSLAFAAALVLLLTPSPSLAQSGKSWLDENCRRDAARYDELISLKRTVTPERVADVYVEAFTTKGADRDAQAVWRRMNAEGDTVEQAIEAHLARYHAKRSADERATLKAEITGQIRDMTLIHDLVLAFESASINADFTAGVSEESWRKQRWDAPHPIEYYVAIIKSKAKGYMSSGLDEEQAAVRAAVEARAAVDRDRGVPRGAIIGKGNVCFKDELKGFEIWLRHAAIKPAMGQWTEVEKAEVADDDVLDSDKLSRLSYYTHYKFGPRDYSFDRLRAWRMAAQDPAVSEKRRQP